MKGFLALSIVTLWLTTFPFQVFLLKDTSLFLFFLAFHGIGYLILYLTYRKTFIRITFIISLSLVQIFTLLFPYLSPLQKTIAISTLGLLSPLISLWALSLLKSEDGKLWPYTGLIFGNLLSLLLSLTGFKSLFAYHLILSISLLPLFFLKVDPPLEKVSSVKLYIKKPDMIYMYIGIFLFYLITPLLYNNFSSTFISFKTYIYLDLIFHSFGILISLFYIKRLNWTYKSLFIIAITFISFGNIVFHLETITTFYLQRFLFFIGIGIMNLLILFIFVNFFHDLRPLSILYSLITLSILTGNLIYKSVLKIEKDYILSYLALISLLSLLSFYKMNLDIRKEDLFVEEIDEEILKDILAISNNLTLSQSSLTPQILQEKLNQTLDSTSKKLSKRECQVLYYYALEDKNLTEIAEILQISRSSAKEYLKRACLKLDVSQYELKEFLKDILSKP